MTLTAADILARRLYDAGVRHAFGMPGGEVLTLIRALAKAGIAFVLAKHETAAGFMAEAAYHRTGAPGVMVATLGPGAMNGVNAVANALQDRVPLIVLTGCVDADEAQSYTHQVMDHGQVFAPICKATFRFSAGAAAIIADRAVTTALAPRCGPVHIDVPISTAGQPVPPGKPWHRDPPLPAVATEGPALQAVRAAVLGAKRPVAIIGLDVMQEASGTAVQAVLERLHIPFVTTYKAKGVIPEDHPLCLGAAGLSPKADALILPFVQAADLVLCLGYDPIEMRAGWQHVWDPAETCVIDIAAAPNTHYMHRATYEIVGHVGANCAMLAPDVAPAPATWPKGEVAALQQALSRAFPVDTDWGPAGVIGECMAVLPPDTLATVDSGAHRILLSQMWRCTAPRSLMQSSGLCTMGCAVPLAIGTSILAPDRPVVSFSGDAGFLMALGELATAAERKLRTIFVVFVDASLALIEKKQRENQMPNLGVDFGWHDYAALGRAFGGAGAQVRNRAELRAALDAALICETFTVIAAEIDRQGYDGLI